MPVLTPLQRALLELNQLIRAGYEFPDALFRITNRYPTVSADELTEAYDNQE